MPLFKNKTTGEVVNRPQRYVDAYPKGKFVPLKEADEKPEPVEDKPRVEGKK